MVGQRLDATLAQEVARRLALIPRDAVHDAALVVVLALDHGHDLFQRLGRALLVLHLVLQVLAVEGLHEEGAFLLRAAPAEHTTK